MKRLLFSLIALVSIGMSAQTQIIGVVADSITHEGMPYVTVRIYNNKQKDKPVAAFVTGVDGRFVHSVAGSGPFRILYSAVGMQNEERQILLGGSGKLPMDTVYMQERSLGTAEVVAQRPIVKMETDKVTYDLTSDADTKSATLLDMLRKVPLVTVDGNDNITVNGSSNFKVYVDGKNNPMLSANASLVMKSIPASYAKNIEVITNPGAKYDAEGVGGILNITTNRGGAGGGGATDGSLDGYSAKIDGTLTNRSERAGAFVSWQKKKFSMNLNVMYQHQKQKGSVIDMTNTQYLPGGATQVTNLHQEGNTNQHFVNSGLNLSYQIDSLRLLTAGGSFMSFQQKMEGNGIMQNGAVGYGQNTDQKMRFGSITANIDYQRSFANNPEKFFTLSYQFNSSPSRDKQYTDFDLSAFTPTTPGATPTYDITNRFSDNDMFSTEHTGQIDYTTPLSKNHKMSVGLKFIGRNNHSDSQYFLQSSTGYVYNPAMSMQYRHINDIGAGYAEYEGNISKFKLKAGLRYEYTWQQVKYEYTPAQNFDLHYDNLVPSATLSYQLKPTQSVGISYGMRISRPDINSLNPYMNISDPTNVSYGNPNLEAEKNHNISLVFNSFSQKLITNINVHYNFCNNGIEEYKFYDAKNVLNTTYGNLNKNKDIGVNLFLNYRPMVITSIILNANVSYVDLSAPSIGAKNHGWNTFAMLGLQQTLWWNTKLSLNVMGMGKRHNLQGYMKGFGGFMGSLTKSFLKDKLTVGIAGFMPFNGKNIKIKMHSEGADFMSDTNIRVPVAQIGITCSYTIGNIGSVKKVNRSIENNDVNQTGKSQDSTGGMGGGMGTGTGMGM